MKSKNQRSILITVFIPFTILFLICFTCIIFYYIVNEGKKSREDSLLSIENNLLNISNNADSLVETLDTVSQNVIYSNLVKEHFANYVNYTKLPSGEQPYSEYNNIQNSKILYDLLVAMIGPNTPADQIYLYGLDRGCFGAGLDVTATNASVQDKEWYAPVMAEKGSKYLFRDSDERLTKYYSYEDGQYFLSLSRVYYNSFNSPQGIIEVKKSLSSLTQLIHSYHYTAGEEFYIFDKDGNLIYPFTSSPSASAYYNSVFDDNIKEVERSTCKLKQVDQTYLLYQTSSYSGFTTIAKIDKANLSSVFQNISGNLFLLFVTLSALIVVSYLISKRIVTPLQQMYSQVHSFQLTSDTLTGIELKEVDTNITELKTLYDALIKMQEQARLYMQRELQLQSKEMQARMLALQAQMNPHFLYNSLATIQAMADEGMTEEIETMCQNISRILRYISSDGEQLVSIRHEVAHTTDYLECMKIRYDHELHYSIELPEKIYEYKIPKLCLQLIVENAIKYTTMIKGPWYITISGRLTKTHWEIQIKDNGPGFDPDKLSLLEQKIKEIDRTGVLPNLEINGMGLLNSYIRFKLLFEGKAIFRLSNCVPSGALVTIGGLI